MRTPTAALVVLVGEAAWFVLTSSSLTTANVAAARRHATAVPPGVDLAALLAHDWERLGLVGVVTISAMSGWGAVHGPYLYGPWFVKTFDEAQIRAVAHRLRGVQEQVSTLKRRLVLVQGHAAVPASMLDADPLAPTLNARASRGGGPKPESLRVADLAARVAAMEMLSTELFLELNEMHLAKRSVQFRKTRRGRVYTALGFVFAAYCVLKVVGAAYSLVWPRPLGEPDLATRVIRASVSLLASSPELARVWAQSLSFALVGILVFNSFRGLLMNAGKAVHAFGWSADATSHALASLVLTEVVGLYLLSSAILLNLNMPHEYRHGTEMSASLNRLDYWRTWMDAVFLLSAGASAAYLYFADRARALRTEFYDDVSGGSKRRQDAGKVAVAFERAGEQVGSAWAQGVRTFAGTKLVSRSASSSSSTGGHRAASAAERAVEMELDKLP